MADLRVLIADDDRGSRTIVSAMLQKAGFEVEAVADGQQAWDALQNPDRPALAIMDWMMPGLDGPEICRRLRAMDSSTPTYVILLTSRDASADVVAGLRSGADDYITKPPDQDELIARVNVGARVVRLQQALADRVRRLEEALSNVKRLQGLLPICSYCKRIRDDQNYWRQVESYIGEHSDVQFSHSYCPDCYERYVKPQIDELDNEMRNRKPT
jgi:sigma-B regulation protein RsbU (phosphoserine phosphatase)